MPTFSKTKTFATNESPIASADLNSIGNDVATFLNVTKLDADNIQSGSITNTLLAGSIAASKLLATTPGYILLGTTTTGVPTFTALSGDATITGGGVLTIANNAITNAKMADDAVDSAEIADGAIDLVHMSANSVDSDQYVDGSIDTDHIADSQVTAAKLASGAVTLAKLATAILVETTGTTSYSMTTNTEAVDLRTSFTAPTSGKVRVTFQVNLFGNGGTNGASSDLVLKGGTNSTHNSNSGLRAVRVGGFGASAVGFVPVTMVHSWTGLTPGSTYYLTASGGTSSGTATFGTTGLSPVSSILVEAVA